MRGFFVGEPPPGPHTPPLGNVVRGTSPAGNAQQALACPDH